MLGAELQVQTDCSVFARHCKASDDTLLAPEQARDVMLWSLVFFGCGARCRQQQQDAAACWEPNCNSRLIQVFLHAIAKHLTTLCWLLSRHVMVSLIHGEEGNPALPAPAGVAAGMGHSLGTAARYYDRQRPQREAQRAVAAVPSMRSFLQQQAEAQQLWMEAAPAAATPHRRTFKRLTKLDP